MANENDIGGRVGLDITDFKTNIAELNRQIRVIDTGFRLASEWLVVSNTKRGGLSPPL